MSNCIPNKLFDSITYAVNTNFRNVKPKTKWGASSVAEANYGTLYISPDYKYVKMTDYYSGTVSISKDIYIMKLTFAEDITKDDVNFETYPHTVNCYLADGTYYQRQNEAGWYYLWKDNVCYVVNNIVKHLPKLKYYGGSWLNGVRVNKPCTMEMFLAFNEICQTRQDYVNWFEQLPTITETKTISIGATELAKLTDEDKKIATDKGWTLA